MQRPLLGQVVDVLQGLWALDEAGVFESESGSWASLAMETYLLEWVETAPDWVFDPRSQPAAEPPDQVSGQAVLPFGGEG